MQDTCNRRKLCKCSPMSCRRIVCTPPGYSELLLVADTYFGSHEVAATLADQKRPFLMLTKRSELGVEEASAGLRPGETNSVVNVEHGYNLTVSNDPKVGKKPARCVPFLTNCDMGPRVPHRTGKYTVPGIVGQYRRLSPGVDSFNQLTLQHREEQRFSAWYKAVNGMMLRFATVNAFSTCHNLKLAHGGDTLFDW